MSLSDIYKTLTWIADKFTKYLSTFTDLCVKSLIGKVN
jgi:hypothetical protein